MSEFFRGFRISYKWVVHQQGLSSRDCIHRTFDGIHQVHEGMVHDR